MPVMDAINKVDKLVQVQVLFLQHPEGVKTREVAEFLNVSQRTARRYLSELSERGRLPVYREGRVWKLVAGAKFDLLPVRLNLDEALSLYLAARMLSAYSDKHNSHVVSALFKLASAMPKPVGKHIERAAEAVAQRRVFPGYMDVLEGLVQAWAERRQLHIDYRDAQGKVSQRVFDTYFIEPSFAGYACYAIGYDHFRGEIRIFKAERIEQVKLLNSTYEVQVDFDPYAYLQHAWGIMGGDEVVEVKLRFAPRVVHRIRESDWPGVIGAEVNDDASCTLTFCVNHVLEMKPWIRGWGEDCEVLLPQGLREEIAGEMRRAGALYGKDKQ